MDLPQLRTLKDGDKVVYHDLVLTIEKVLSADDVPVVLVVYRGNRDCTAFQEMFVACGNGHVTPDGLSLQRVH